MVLEKTLESPLDCKEIQPVHPKGNQSWLFIGRNDAKAETPVLWPPHAKSWLIWKDLDAEKDWRQEEKGMTKDKMVGWYHRLNGHEWVNSRSWWWSGRPGILQSMGSQRVPHAWVTELNWTGPDLPAGLGESPGEAGGCHSLWGHSITGKRQRSYWLISINTTPGPAQQSAVHVLVLGLKPNNLKGQTQPRPSADTPLDMWGLHMWAKLQLHPPGTGTRSKKLGSTMQVTPSPGTCWALSMPTSRPTQALGRPPPYPLLNCISKYSPPSASHLPHSDPRKNPKRVLGSLICSQTPGNSSAASGLALTPGPGFTCQWVGSSPESLGP